MIASLHELRFNIMVKRIFRIGGYFLLILFIFILRGMCADDPKHTEYSHANNIIKTKNGGKYIGFRNNKDIRREYIKITGIKVPEKDYSFSCTRSIDGSELYMVETNNNYNAIVHSCAIIKNGKCKKTYKNLSIVPEKVGFFIPERRIIFLLNDLGYSGLAEQPGKNEKNVFYKVGRIISRFGKYYIDAPNKFLDRDTTATLYLTDNISNKYLVNIPKGYLLNDVLEINKGFLMIFSDRTHTKLLMQFFNSENKYVNAVRQFKIPKKWKWLGLGYTSLSVVEYNPAGTDMILYAGQDSVLLCALYMLDIKNNKLTYLGIRRWQYYYQKDQ